MKIQKIKIHKIRGLHDTIIEPNCKNFVVYGKNGSGKSGTIDAIDFLLTGKIQRLTGKGTKGITLSEYGPHIDEKNKEESYVEAEIKLQELSNTITIKREFVNPSRIIVDKDNEDILLPYLKMAESGNHILTRNELLKFIIAEGSTRAQEVVEILNLQEITTIRIALQKLYNNYKKNEKLFNSNLQMSQNALLSIHNLDTVDPVIMLQKINEDREILGGKRISKIDCERILEGCSTKEKNNTPNIINLNNQIQFIDRLFSDESKEQVIKYIRKINNLEKKLIKDRNLEKTAIQAKLIKLGIDLLDGTGKCPLCDTEWLPTILETYLIEKQEKSLLGTEIVNEFNETISNLETIIKKIVVGLTQIKLEISTFTDDAILRKINRFIKTAEKADNYFDKCKSSLRNKFPEAYWNDLFGNEIVNTLSELSRSVESSFSNRDPKELSFERLLLYKERYPKYLNDKQNYENISVLLKRAEFLFTSYEKIKDETLSNLYERVEDRFSEFYKYIHGEDEKDFKAKLLPTGSSLDFRVDFYKRGLHPPNALHSEGHQDSMGICLFLALSEVLSKDWFELIILDDVVMSVDATHRKGFCKLLKTYFPNKQFFITTHDEIWAKQLKFENVIDSNNLIKFYNWKIDSGPSVSTQKIVWENILEDINNDEIPEAAAKLRRGLEEYSALLCDALHVPVKYKIDQRYELGDMLNPLISQLGKYIKSAKGVSQKRNDASLESEIIEFEENFTAIKKQINHEQWSINPAVHFNEWASFCKEDFSPVYYAFKNLIDLFFCDDCRTPLSYNDEIKKDVFISCTCKKILWKL